MPAVRERSARQPAADIFHRVGTVRQRLEVGRRFAQFQKRRAFAGARHDQMDLGVACRAKFLEQPPPVDGAAGAGDSHHQADGLISHTPNLTK